MSSDEGGCSSLRSFRWERNSIILLLRHPRVHPRLHFLARLITALYTTAVAIYSLAVVRDHGKWFVFFTDINYSILCAFLWVTAFLTNKYWDFPFENAFRVELTWFHKLLAIVFALAFTNALFLDIVYWTMLYSPGQADFVTVNVHCVNFVIIALYAMSCAAPIEWPNMFIIVVFALAYTGFAWIYHNASNEWIYPFLSTSSSLWPIMYLLLIVFLCSIFCFVKGMVHLRNKFQPELFAHRRMPFVSEEPGGDDEDDESV
eukprot:TRINITY_DN82808_c0_g1_i1.p1 TRINITY_DN82808_c0_g1~~TRINITY_DN82808_c0_g1_i1.p1  ORF type:complete len:260 (+),score=34.25 TRINITY_DN82808_c0_g1_i1:74-853(+)